MSRQRKEQDCAVLAMMIENWLGEEQFAVQLMLEDLTPAAIRERAAISKRKLDAAHVELDLRMTMAVYVLLALLQSPALSEGDRYDRFEAFCEGLGVLDRKAWERFHRILQDVTKDDVMDGL